MFVNGIRGVTAFLVGEYRVAEERLLEAEFVTQTRFAGMTLELNSARQFLMGVWRELGAFKPWHERSSDFIRDAVRRGDLLAETNTRRICSLLRLVCDDPDEARRDLERKLWVPPEGIYHVQHWETLQARAELALYLGESEAVFDELRPGFAQLERSLMYRFQYLRIAATTLWGRLALAIAERAESSDARRRHRRRGVRAARALERERTGFADVWAALLRAGVAAVDGDDEETRARLAWAATRADAMEMAILSAVARRLEGLLVGGDAGREAVARAERWMRESLVRDPTRLTRVFAPGFERLADA
jgi:hypothetical protein